MRVQTSSEYLRMIAAQNAQKQAEVMAAAQTTDQNASQKDSYQSTVEASTEPLPSETYSSIMELIKANKQAAGETSAAPTEEEYAAALELLNASASEEADETADAESTTAGGLTGSGDSEESSETETTTETYVGPDGAVYLKTTTTDADGNETVSVTKIADAQGKQEQPKAGNPLMPEEKMEESAKSGVYATSLF